MKIFVLFTLFIFLLYVSMNLILSKKINQISDIQFMNRNYTTILKGISIIFILWGHVGAKLGVEGIQFIAGIGVTLFLICSGYGIMYSYMLKGLDNYWIKNC